MNNLITIFFSILTFTTCFGQTNAETTKKNYCDWTGCTLKPDDPTHFNPYYNRHLCENFNPKQTDFSKEYFDLRMKWYSKDTNQLQKSLAFEYSLIWQTDNSEQNGVIGLNYQRIQIHIGNVNNSKKNSDTYIVSGKSKVNDNICDFSGELKLLKLFISECDDTSKKKCGELFASYLIYEDSSQNHSGYFKGVMECEINLDSTGKKMLLDDTYAGADGYFNRTFIGTWTDYKIKETKKCIWGDYRLPFTFDFDWGDGSMVVNPKYFMNGWQTYEHESENKWWLTK